MAKYRKVERKTKSIKRQKSQISSEKWDFCCLFGISVICLVLSLCVWNDRDHALIALALVELNCSVNECVKRIVLTNSYVVTGVVLGTTLANNNVTCDALLTTEDLDAKSLSS